MQAMVMPVVQAAVVPVNTAAAVAVHLDSKQVIWRRQKDLIWRRQEVKRKRIIASRIKGSGIPGSQGPRQKQFRFPNRSFAEAVSDFISAFNYDIPLFNYVAAANKAEAGSRNVDTHRRGRISVEELLN